MLARWAMGWRRQCVRCWGSGLLRPFTYIYIYILHTHTFILSRVFTYLLFFKAFMSSVACLLRWEHLPAQQTRQQALQPALLLLLLLSSLPRALALIMRALVKNFSLTLPTNTSAYLRSVLITRERRKEKNRECFQKLRTSDPSAALKRTSPTHQTETKSDTIL